MTGIVQTQKIFFAMGTVNTITVFEKADEALAKAKERVQLLDQKLSAYSHGSEIYAVNESAGIAPVTVSADTFRLIEHSVMYSEMTDGLFDITSRPLSQLWKNVINSGRLPDECTINEARKLVNYNDIILNHEKRTVMLKNKEQQLDLGGVAKGYAADEVKNILLTHGIENAVINFGGTVINMGKQRNIGIQKPFAANGSYAASVRTENGKAVVSSGLYEQFRSINERFIHHIADVRTGGPSDSGLLGVTLTGDNAEELDAFATSAFIMGAEKSMELLKRHNIEAVFITGDKKIYVTENLREKVRT